MIEVTPTSGRTSAKVAAAWDQNLARLANGPKQLLKTFI
jgi:hypothetical protein